MIAALRNLLFRDLGLKLFSFAAAVLIWVTVNYAILQEQERQNAALARLQEKKYVSVPVLVMSTAADVREFRVEPSSVDVIVHARPEVLAKLKSASLHPIVDLTGTEGMSGLRKNVELSFPQDVAHWRTVPETVQVVVLPRR